MSTEHARYADWDAAYAIGALSAAERSEFEAHLEQCALCRRAVAELVPTVALLPRLSAQEARGADAGDIEADAAVRAGIASLARVRRARRRRTWWIASAAAVVLAVGAVAVPATVASMSAPTTAFDLEDVADVPLVARVRLFDAGWGTRIELDCRYPGEAGAGAPAGGWEYALAVVDGQGEATTVSTWRAAPGSDARLSAATATSVSGIRAIEIRSADGTVLMRRTLPADGG